MARIAGVNIPTAKRVPIALTYITGIGNSSAQSICEAVGIDLSRRVNELSDAESWPSASTSTRISPSKVTCAVTRR